MADIHDILMCACGIRFGLVWGWGWGWGWGWFPFGYPARKIRARIDDLVTSGRQP